jgi:hypothetical protein
MTERPPFHADRSDLLAAVRLAATRAPNSALHREDLCHGTITRSIAIFNIDLTERL